MDFMMGLPRNPKGNDAIWKIVDRLTKTTHFLPYGTGLTLDGLEKLYVDEIVQLHETPRNSVRSQLQADSKILEELPESHGIGIIFQYNIPSTE